MNASTTQAQISPWCSILLVVTMALYFTSTSNSGQEMRGGTCPSTAPNF